MAQMARDLKILYGVSFPGHDNPEIAKLIGRVMTRLVAAFKLRESAAGRTGQTRNEYTPDENLVRYYVVIGSLSFLIVCIY